MWPKGVGAGVNNKEGEWNEGINDSEVVSSSERIDEDTSVGERESQEEQETNVSKASDWICCVGCFDFLVPVLAYVN